MRLSDLIDINKKIILANLYLGRVKWDNLLRRLDQAEKKIEGSLNDEQVWTFLACCAYAIGGSRQVESMTLLLTEGEVHADKLWIEVLPYPPRLLEGNTNLVADLEGSKFPLRAGLPEPDERISILKIHWVSYEDLILCAPESKIKPELITFFKAMSDSVLSD